MDMDIGGPSWAGWRFAPWGRAKEWRLHAPDGASYDAYEIAELRRMALDLDYLQVRCRELEARLAQQACYFTSEEADALRLMVSAIERELAIAHRRPGRWPPARLAAGGGRIPLDPAPPAMVSGSRKPPLDALHRVKDFRAE